MDNNTLAIYMNELRNQAIQTKGAFDLFNQALEAKASTGVLFALDSSASDAGGHSPSPIQIASNGPLTTCSRDRDA